MRFQSPERRRTLEQERTRTQHRRIEEIPPGNLRIETEVACLAVEARLWGDPWGIRHPRRLLIHAIGRSDQSACRSDQSNVIVHHTIRSYPSEINITPWRIALNCTTYHTNEGLEGG